MVRTHDRRQGILQHLKALDAALHPIAVAVVLQESLPLGGGLGRLAHFREQVDEVTVVGDPVQIQPAEEIRRERLLVIERHPVSVAAGALVIRKVLKARRAGILRVEIAVLALHLHAALAQIARRKSCILFGRDVPIIRRAQFKAAARGLRVARREESGLASLLKREGHPWENRDRVVQEAQFAVADRCGFLVVVHLERCGLDAPVVLAGFASRERPVTDDVVAFAEKIDSLGRAASRLGAPNRERGAFEYSCFAGRIETQL